MGMNRSVETGSGTVAFQFEPHRPFARVTDILYHGNAVGGAGDLTVTKESIEGAQHNTVMLKKDMTSIQDFFEGGLNFPLMRGDKLSFSWTNGSAVTWGIEIFYNTEG